jgi:ferredoxin
MRVIIDRNECISCGSCVEICPEVYKIDVDGKAAVTERYSDKGPAQGDIPGEAIDCAERAAQSCPVNVITVD